LINLFGRQKADALDPSAVKDKATFLAFMDALRRDLRDNRGNWENSDLASFLEALCAWTNDSKRHEKNPWRQAARLLIAARGYE
jgi:hypothetical protein